MMHRRRARIWPLICALSACTANIDGVGDDDAGRPGAGGGDGTRGGSGGMTASGAGGDRSTGAGGVTASAGGRTGSGAGGMTGSAGASGMGGRGGAGVGGRTGTGGAGGATGSGGGTGNPTVCNFASGLNVAWINFANDVPNPNIGAFQTLFQNTFAAGGRVVRWWYHTNGTVTPGYDGNGLARPITAAAISGT